MMAMAGVSKAHVIITRTFHPITLLVNYLRGTGCIAYPIDMKVRIPALNFFYYPDVTVTCDDLDRRSTEDFILHPKLSIEVLTDSTEPCDRGDKFANYKTIPALEDYVLIHQKQILVEQFQRSPNNLWIPKGYRKGDILELASIHFSCPIGSLYSVVRCPAEPQHLEVWYISHLFGQDVVHR